MQTAWPILVVSALLVAGCASEPVADDPVAALEQLPADLSPGGEASHLETTLSIVRAGRHMEVTAVLQLTEVDSFVAEVQGMKTWDEGTEPGTHGIQAKLVCTPDHLEWTHTYPDRPDWNENETHENPVGRCQGLETRADLDAMLQPLLGWAVTDPVASSIDQAVRMASTEFAVVGPGEEPGSFEVQLVRAGQQVNGTMHVADGRVDVIRGTHEVEWGETPLQITIEYAVTYGARTHG